MTNSDFPLARLQPFLTAHPGRGTLRVQVTAAQGAFPVPQAAVEVFALPEGEPLPLYRRYTDPSGIVRELSLPAGPPAASRQEATADESATYYHVGVFHSGFVPCSRQRVAIYDGVETILPVVLQPLVG